MDLQALHSAEHKLQVARDETRSVRKEEWLSHQSEVGPTHPDYYKRNALFYGNNVNQDLEDVYGSWTHVIPSKVHEEAIHEMVYALSEMDLETDQDLERGLSKLRKKYRIQFRKTQLLYVYRILLDAGKIKETSLGRLLVKKSIRSTSGVLVITIVTSPYPTFGEGKDRVTQKFSCKWNCYYCPNEPNQPRSYLHDEPSVLRANQNKFDPVLQFTDRALSLAMNGHPVDKIECIVLGGTWSSYPDAYKEEYCRDIFYAANTFSVQNKPRRARFSLAEEQKINETATVKVIGLTLETRPDCINAEEIRRFREFGCTRVQLGVQHTDEYVLTKINRECYTEDVYNAVKLLKDNCYKIDIHLMPNLPGSNAAIDKKMFETVLSDEGLQVDQWKIYPCEIVPWTIIKKWFDEGQFVPYDQDELKDVLKFAKTRVHPWIRLNRVIRDIPMQYVSGALEEANLRQVVIKEMNEEGTKCRCIRCREVRDLKKEVNPKLVTREYKASGGDEYFVSFESGNEDTIYAFLRLRLSKDAGMDTENDKVLYPTLLNTALIRELHVYGKLIATYQKGKTDSQHVGLGTRLMHEAERVAKAKGYHRVAVIAGVGVRNFYARLGYKYDDDTKMMIKEFNMYEGLSENILRIIVIVMALIVLFISMWPMN